MKNEKDKVTGVSTEGATAPLAEENKTSSKKKSQNPKRWTAVDTVLLLMLLLAVGGILLRGFLPESSLGENGGEDMMSGPYYVDFAVAEIHPLVLGEINAFDPLYLYETGDLVGYVGVYDDGSMALHTVNPLANGGSTVSAEGCMVCLEGMYRDGSLLVKGMDTYLSPGSILTLRTDRAVLTVEITAIRASE